MHDPRVDQLARQLVRYSTQVKKGDFVWIDCFDVPSCVPQALIRAVVEAKGRPIVRLHDTTVSRELLRRILEDTEHHIDFLETQLNLIKLMGEANYIQSAMKEIEGEG